MEVIYYSTPSCSVILYLLSNATVYGAVAVMKTANVHVRV